MATVEQLQKQLAEEIRVKNEIIDKTQKLLLSKKQLKDQFDIVVAERNSLQQKLTSNDKVDIVKQLQEKLDKASVTTDSSGVDLRKEVEQLTEQNKRLEAQLREARLTANEKPGLLAGKPSAGEQYYIISAAEAEGLTKRIKKLQTELWNLEIKHQQLQESSVKISMSQDTKGEESVDSESLRDALRKEKEFSIALLNRHKGLTDAISELKDDLRTALEQNPNDPLLQAVFRVAQKTMAANESVLIMPPEYKKERDIKDSGSPSLGRLSSSEGKKRGSVMNEKDLRPPSPLTSALAAKEKEKADKRGSSVKKVDKEKDKDKERDRRSKVIKI